MKVTVKHRSICLDQLGVSSLYLTNYFKLSFSIMFSFNFASACIFSVSLRAVKVEDHVQSVCSQYC